MRLFIDSLLFIGAIFIIAVLLGLAYAHAECLPSHEAVHRLHPGSHSSYSGPRGGKPRCYFADGFQNTVSVLDRPRSRSSYDLGTPQAAGAGRIPIPRERLEDTDHCTPEEGQALADELLPLSVIGKKMLLAEMERK